MKKIDRDEVARLRVEERLTLQEIADRYGVSRQRIHQITPSLGYEIRDERAAATREQQRAAGQATARAWREKIDQRRRERADLISRAVESGLTYAQIAPRIGYSSPKSVSVEVWRLRRDGYHVSSRREVQT